MRPSSRDSLIAAAKAIALESGFEGLTFEALTARTGLTRSGIVYHFSLRESLVEEACKALAAEWEEELLGHLAKPFEEATPLERARAYLAASAEPANPRLFSIFTAPSAANLDPNPWRATLARWVPKPPSATAPDDLSDLFVVRVIADGLSAYRALTGRPMNRRAREAVVRRADWLLRQSSAASPPDQGA